MNFEAELKKLLDAEETPLLDPLAELARAQAGFLEVISKQGSDVSLQVEEIYDIVKSADENAKEIKNAAKRENLLLSSMIAMNDMLDSLMQYIGRTDARHSETIASKRDELMNVCGLERLGLPGQQLDPRIHTVAAAEFDEAPPESVIRVLESGYLYRGNVVRKATVIISKGSENA